MNKRAGAGRGGEADTEQKAAGSFADSLEVIIALSAVRLSET